MVAEAQTWKRYEGMEQGSVVAGNIVRGSNMEREVTWGITPIFRPGSGESQWGDQGNLPKIHVTALGSKYMSSFKLLESNQK